MRRTTSNELSPAPSANAAEAEAASSASSSHSSPLASAPLKKCVLCQHQRPECDYSGAQLKAKAKRQCKSCVRALQAAQARASPSKPVAVPTDVSARLAKCSSLLHDSSESQHLSGLQKLTDLLAEMLSVDISPHLDGALVTRVVDLVRHARSLGLHSAAVGCVVQICHHPPLVAALVGAGSIPLLLQGLRYNKTEAPRIGFTRVLSLIASAPDSSGHCDALLAAGALPVLLELLEPITAPEVCEASSRLFSRLLPGLPPTEVSAAVAHFGAIIVDLSSATPPLVCCLKVLAFAATFCNPVQQSAWNEAVLSVAPGLPQRLVDLLADDRAEVRAATVSVVAMIVHPGTQWQMQTLCGLIGRLLPLLSVGSEGAHAATLTLCGGIAHFREFAPLLLDEAPLVRRVLELLFTASGEMLVHALSCLKLFLCMLQTGDAEAADDPHGINPYIEPVDWLGAFELVDPLRSHSDSNLASVAEAVFAYFIPNDWD